MYIYYYLIGLIIDKLSELLTRLMRHPFLLIQCFTASQGSMLSKVVFLYWLWLTFDKVGRCLIWWKAKSCLTPLTFWANTFVHHLWIEWTRWFLNHQQSCQCWWHKVWVTVTYLMPLQYKQKKIVKGFICVYIYIDRITYFAHSTSFHYS